MHRCPRCRFLLFISKPPNQLCIPNLICIHIRLWLTRGDSIHSLYKNKLYLKSHRSVGSISENFSLVRGAYKEISATLKINSENYVWWAVRASQAMKKRKRDLIRWQVTAAALPLSSPALMYTRKHLQLFTILFHQLNTPSHVPDSLLFFLSASYSPLGLFNHSGKVSLVLLIVILTF